MIKPMQFLSGGGEMGALMRANDWESTPLGHADKWPQSLLTTLNILLNSKFPMSLFWGPDLVCFYNDAYRPSLGNEGKHPWSLGKKGEEVWPEIWHSIKPLIDQVLGGGESTWSEDQLIPILRNGKMEDVYWTFSYSPAFSDNGKINGVFVTCTETTNSVVARKKLEEKNDQLNFAIEATELGTWDFNPLTNKFITNNRLKDWSGLPHEKEVDFSTGLNLIAEHDRSRVSQAFQSALEYESGGLYDIEYTIINAIDKEERIVRAKGKAWFGEDKKPYRFTGTFQDITEQALSRRKIEASEKRTEVERNKLYDFFTQAPAILAILKGSQHVFEFANPPYLELIGNRNPIGMTVLESLPEAAGQGFIEMLDKVYTTGETITGKEVPLEIDKGNGKHKEFFLNFTYQAFKNDNGETEGILVFAYDVSEQVNARKKIEESENSLREMTAYLKLATDSANIGTWSLDVQTQELEWSVLHKRMWGYDAHRTDLTYEDWHILILPEDKEKAFREVENAKVNHTVYDVEYSISRADDLTVHHMRSVGKYYFNNKGEAETLTGISIDITQQKESELKLKASEEKYRGIFETMDQGFSIIELIFDSDNKPVDCIYIETNPVFEKQTGLKNVTGKTVKELIPNIEERWFQIYGKVALTGEPNRFIEGSEALGRWFETYAFRLGDQGSKKVAVLFTDITERKQNEETLRYRQALLEAHNEANRDGLLLVDAKGKIISYNQSFIEVWRIPQEIVDAKDDELALEFAMTQLVNPQQFIDKVKWLYEHPSETSIDELVFLDDRIIERHGYSVVGEDGTYYAWSWTYRDITEQKAAAEAIKESETRFRTMAEATEVLIGVADEASNVTYFNKAWVDLTGRPMEDLLKLGWADLLHPEDKDRVVDTYLSAFANQEGYELEFRILNKSGEYSWLLAKVPARFHPDGTFAGYISASVDITDRKKAEEKIKEARELFETTLENVSSGIYHFDKTGKILYLNEIGANQIGYATVDEVLAEKDVFQLRKRAYETFTVLNEQGKPMPADQNSTELTFKTGKFSEVVSQLIHKKTGASFWLLSRASPIYDQNGGLIKVLATTTDITLQKISEQSLRQSEDQFRTFANSIQNLAWIANVDGQRYWYNQRWYDYTGTTFEEMQGLGWGKVHHPDHLEKMIALKKEAWKKDEAFELTFPIRRHDGEYRWFLTRAYPVKDAYGTTERWIGTNTDITEQKKSLEQKDEFISIASHEMKTPLTTAKGYIELLLMILSEENQSAYLYANKANKALEKLNSLITDLLDASKIQHGQLNYSIDAFDFDEMVDEAIEDIQLTAKNHSLEKSGNCPQLITGDRDRLKQVMINLLTNAVKYSPEGEKVFIKVEDQVGKIKVSVQDFGVGMSGQHLDKVFDRYYRVQENAVQFQGLGIGLHLSSTIIQRHEGKIWVESGLGKGSIFYFTLPLQIIKMEFKNNEI